MPVSREDLLKALNKQDNKEWLRRRADWKFLRASLDRALVGNKEGAMEYITAPRIRCTCFSTFSTLQKLCK